MMEAPARASTNETKGHGKPCPCESPFRASGGGSALRGGRGTGLGDCDPLASQLLVDQLDEGLQRLRPVDRSSVDQEAGGAVEAAKKYWIRLKTVEQLISDWRDFINTQKNLIRELENLEKMNRDNHDF